MPFLDDLRRQVQHETLLVTEITEDFSRELRRVLRRTERRAAQLMTTLETKGRRLVASQAALARALRLRVEIQAALEQAGYPALVATSLDAPLDRLTAEVLKGRALTARAARLTPLDVDILGAWKTIRRADLLELGDDVVTSVWRSTVDGVMANRDVTALTDEIALITETSERQARTIYDTAASTYSRQVDQLDIVASPNDRFVYVGPDDNRTRPFCRAQLGEERTRADLDDVSNGQLPNTLLTGGGWNCRHKWVFLPGSVSATAPPLTPPVSAFPPASQRRLLSKQARTTVRERYIGHLNAISESDQEQVSWYTGSGHSLTNQLLRARGSITTPEQAALQRVLQTAPRPPEDLIVWRGMHYELPDAYRVKGAEFQLQGFQSATIDPDIATDFGRTLLEIKPKSGAYVEALSRHRSELEFIIPHGSRVRVVGEQSVTIGEFKKKRRVIQVEVIDDGETTK